MQNLRIVNVEIIDSTNINIIFTENLTKNLVTSNVSINSETSGVPTPQVLKIKVSGNKLSIICQPLTPFAYYYIELVSVPNYRFQSLNGNAIVSEDGIINRYYFIGPIEADNPVKNYLDSFFYGNIYNNTDSNSIVSKYITALSNILSKSLYDMRQLKNENYLNFDVVDEVKVRGPGPFDRLDEGAAYKILRVGRTPAGTSVSKIFSFTTFPAYPITLQKEDDTEVCYPNSIDEAGYFNTNSLTFNLSTSPVTKVSSIIFTLNTITPVYTYDIETLGYQIYDSRYDQDYAFSYLQLKQNQVKLNENILSDPLFEIDKIIKVDIIFESKDLGLVVNPDTVSVYSVENVSREVLPPIINIFTLDHAPITDASNEIPTLGGITFTDPNTNTGASHPAFLYEIPFRLNAPPTSPGQYSVDYENGTVYVYGSDIGNDGTGAFPPLAAYKYRLTYKSEIDYVYDSDLLEIVALPYGSLIDYTGNIEFEYEKVLVPDIDYKANLHEEVLEERIGNKLLALNTLRTENSPITNVFRIFNETSGEIYNLDRWNNDKIYFTYDVPPRIPSLIGERISFNSEVSETLFVYSTSTNVPGQRVFTIYLKNNTIISGTEDSLGSSFNSSVTFANGNIFVSEKWYNPDYSEEANINKLESVGEYTIDYSNGIVYCAVSSSQSFDIGSITYKDNKIITKNPHIISVDDLYYRISLLESKNKQFEYSSFDDTYIVPATLDLSNEMYLNGSETSPYQLVNDYVGSYISGNFVAGVTNQIKFVRSIFEYDDLNNNISPINFAQFSSSSGFNIAVDNIVKQYFTSVQYDGYDYYVALNENIQYISPNITFEFSIIRSSDGYELWDGGGTIEVGDPLILKLSGVNSPSLGDHVTINYSISINNLSRIIVDYNKGEYYADYTYLADEIIVSYEYGDNIIDFRENTNLPINTEYYVSYKVGALRDSLLKNFGTLVNVPELLNFDIDFNRERYRDALTAALTSFILGPTITAIKNIGKNISHIEPDISESIFINWSLGNSLLYPNNISTEGEFELLPAKFGSGVLVNSSDQQITLPVNSNIRFEEGTFETWIIPQWDGLDNQATLTFNILKDGYTISQNDIFIGAAEYHPIIEDDEFSLNLSQDIIGVPNFNKDGVYIYYDEDSSGNFNRWYVRVIDGYLTPTSSDYRFTISSTGSFYDSKSIILPKPSNLSIFTGTNTIKFSITGAMGIDEGVTFLSDVEHYILDFGKDATQSRLSIFKDISGYINLKVFDKNKNSFTISSDVSAWKSGELHHVAASWKLNTLNGHDEIHLFIDGTEVPNIIRYGQKLAPYLHEKFRTISTEEIIGLADKDILGSNDLTTIADGYIVTSSINFELYNISIGDIFYVEEDGFDSNGYIITNISGQSITLDTPMPFSISDGNFSINKTSFTVDSQIDVAPNIAISTINAYVTGTDMQGTISSNIVSSTLTDFIAEEVSVGDLIHIVDSSLEIIYTILEVNTNSLIINDNMPINFGPVDFYIYSNAETEIPGVRAVRPSYSISKDGYFNNVLTLSNSITAKDLILVRTLGLAHKKVKKQYYVWSDNQENILMTQLPAPISLDEANITKVILPTVSIGPNNSTLISGEFVSSNLACDPPTNSQSGRTLSVTISGTNTDFTTPVSVVINGISGIYTINETINFDDYGTLYSTNKFVQVNYVQVTATPINSARNALNIVVKEKYPITYSENSEMVPVVRYSYNIGSGYNLYNDGYDSVRDDSNLFSELDINNYLLIHSPIAVAGYYKITALSEDRKSITIEPTNQATPLPLPTFTDGIYQVLYVNSYRSGLQNGFFTFETGLLYSQPYFLRKGFYELEYNTYSRIELEPINQLAYIGSDFNSQKQLNGILNQIKLYSTMLTDTRTGETIPDNQRSITKDYNSLKPLKVDTNTLALITFNDFPFTNLADYYINTETDKNHFQSSIVINENFNNSIAILDSPIIVSNEGILDSRKEGTIEFWLNPIFDTGNDPVERFYFDAFGAITEEVVSTNDTSVKVSTPASRIISVKLAAGNNKIDYFAGGTIELDTQNSVQENVISISDNSAQVSNQILQVISVKILGDVTGKDYFAGGTISSDRFTIYFGTVLPSSPLDLIVTYKTLEGKNLSLNTQSIRLNKKLPYHNSKVIVNYIPEGLQGDRVCIFKDTSGYINFAISASGTDYIVRAPTLWSSDTWHRIKASYKINGGLGTDEMRLFLDGYEYSNVTFGSDIIFGSFPVVFGSVKVGAFTAADGYNIIENIIFRDPINQLHIGAEYTGQKGAFALFDNFRISNISRPIYAPFGEPIDVNYNSNLNVVFPVTSDLYTTFLMDFDEMIERNEDFALLKNRTTGIFDFSVDIFDSFSIVNDNIKSKEALEALIKILKPANSRVFINYVR